jgi:LCP family protein required for cell wall assembly
VPIYLLDQRVNILVLGLDRRPGEGDAVRADTIMVLSASAAEPDLGLLSIPRDLYLTIPGQGENRINTAHIFGELARPGDGPSRTAEAITRNFGIPLHGWVRIDFEGFVTVIDVLGGIEIDVPGPIIDDAYPTQDYGVMTVNIPAGPQTMDGERALQYARTRHGSSDFDRAARQQQVVQAVVRRLHKPDTWIRLPVLVKAGISSVETDLSWLQLARLAVAVIRVGPDEMDHLVIDQDLVNPHVTPAGAAVLLPRWERIRPLLGRIFGDR